MINRLKALAAAFIAVAGLIISIGLILISAALIPVILVLLAGFVVYKVVRIEQQAKTPS